MTNSSKNNILTTNFKSTANLDQYNKIMQVTNEKKKLNQQLN